MTHTQEQIDAVAKAIIGPHRKDLICHQKLMELREVRWNQISTKHERAVARNQAIAALGAMPAKEVGKRKMKITHFPEGFDGEGAVVFDSDAPKPDITVQEAARVILRHDGPEYWLAISAMDARMEESPEAAFYAALRALSEGEA